MTGIADIRAAVIGTGFIGTVHVEALRRIGVQVVACSAAPRSAARRAPRRSASAHAYPSLDAILDDPAVDVVHVTSPNHLHVPQARAILAAGKHVVCEKPLAMTATESAELVADRGARRGLVNAVNFNIRFYPLHQHVRELIADGDLGDVRFVTGHYFQDWLFLDTDWNWRLEPDKGGALRAVGDIGSHWIDLVQFLTGRRIVVGDGRPGDLRERPPGAARSGRDVLDRAVDATRSPREMATEDVASILLRFDNGARGVGRGLARSAPGGRTRSSGRSTAPRGRPPGTRRRRTTCGSAIATGRTRSCSGIPALMVPAGQAAAALPGGHVEGFADTFAALFRAIYADVLAGRPSDRPPYATFADGHDEMLVNDADRRERGGGSLDGRRAPRARVRRRRRRGGGDLMRLGFLTAPFPDTPLLDVADWAAATGFEVLEIACWPKATGPTPALRRHEPHRRRQPVRAAQARDIRAEIEARGLAISGLGFYPNPLHPDPAHRDVGHRPPQARDRGGREDGRPAREHLHGRRRREEPGRQLGRGAAGLAGHRRVRAGPRPASSPSRTARCCSRTTSGRAATTSRRRPRMWRRILEQWGGTIGLNFDPSHLILQMIDIRRFLKEFGPHVLHYQAKDLMIDRDGPVRARGHVDGHGLAGPADPRARRRRLGRRPRRALPPGYEGDCIIEHEDRRFEGTDEKVKQGFLIARDVLRPLCH